MSAPSQVDPEVAAALALLPIGQIDFGTLRYEDLPAMRQQMSAARPPSPPTTTRYEDHRVPGPAGDPDITLRVYRAPGTADPAPVLYWMHGGGYIFGSALDPETRLPRWAEELGCVIVSVEYRLAPEHPYPAPLEDCYAGLRWTFDHAAELGIDPQRIVIGGASAGGGLAAGLALLARDRGEVPVTFQLLIYPMIDDRLTTGSSRLDALVWTRGANELGWRAYLGDAAAGEDVAPYAAPARAADLTGLPPAQITVGSCDGFRDEDVDYAMRLLAAGVATELHVYPGAPHGFEGIVPDAAVSRRCQRDIDDALRRALHG